MSIIKGTNKIVAGFGGTKRSIGEVYFSQSSLATDNSGALPLFTGETIASANTIYPEFYNWVLAHTELQCTSAEYEASLTTYGECAKYVIGGGSIRLPLIKNYIKAANTSDGIKNIEAGLPNITGNAKSFDRAKPVASGAFFVAKRISASVGTGGSDDWGYIAGFDASRSSAVYGKSSTVTPASTTLYPWVVAYTAAIPASTAQAAEFQQGLSGKADTNLGNLSTAGKDLASGLGMPSNRYIDLTLGASGTTYTAPANGWFWCGGIADNVQQNTRIVLRRTSDRFGMTANTNGTTASGGYVGAFLPVGKGEVVGLHYVNITADYGLRFYYAISAL